MRNSALLHNVSDRASQAESLAEHTLREVAERVADTASDLAAELGDRVPQVVSVLPALAAPQRRRKRRGRKLLLLAVLVAAGVAIFGWKRRSQAAQLANENRDGFRPYPTDDSAYDQSAIGEAAERMGSTGNDRGGFDPDPTNSHDPDALHEAARRMGVEP